MIIFGKLKKEIEAISGRAIGMAFGLALFYVWLVEHVGFFDLEPSLALRVVGINYDGVLMIFNVVALFGLSFVYLKWRVVLLGRGYFACIGICLAMGYLLGALMMESEISEPAYTSLFIVHCAITCLGMTFLSLEWIRILGSLGTRISLMVIVVASVFAALMLAGLVVIPVFSLPFVPLVVPLGSLAAVVCFYGRQNSALLTKARIYGQNSTLRIPYRLLATVFVSDCVCAAVAFIANALDAGERLQLMPLCYVCAAVLLLVGAVCLRFDFNSLIYKVAFVIMAGGCAVVALPVSGATEIGFAVNQIGYRFMLALAYALSAWLIEQRELSASWVFPVVTGVAFVGQIIGTVGANAVMACFGSIQGPVIAGIILAVLLPIAAIFLLDMRNNRTGWGFSRPASVLSDFESYIDEVCADMAREYKLTAREAEVCTLIVKGYSRNAIGKQLSLSPETVKSYANKMYSKIGLHSRQDLTESVLQRAKSYGFDLPDKPESMLLLGRR